MQFFDPTNQPNVRRRTRPAQSPAVLSELRRTTAAEHERLEESLSLIDPALSLARYQRVLAAFYGYWQPLEARVTQRAARVLVPPFPLRERAGLLRRDLQSFGLTAEALANLPRCARLPRLGKLEELAGCLYVLEGACLGGQVIARFLHRRFGLGPDCGAAFFVGDGQATRLRWEAFLAWLDAVVRGGAARAPMLQSASQTFRTLSRWVERQGGFA